MCFSLFLLGFILCGTLCASWTWLAISFPMLSKFSEIISSKTFSDPFFSSSSSGTPTLQMCILYSPRGLWDYLQIFSFFPLYSALQQLFSLFYVELTYPFFCLTAGPFLPTLLFFHSFLHLTWFCLDLYIPFWWSGTGACSQLVFCEVFWRYIPSASVERDALPSPLVLLLS